MSADNGVYITQWDDGFRVTHAQAIENIDYYPVRDFRWDNYQVKYFGDSEVFPTLDAAFAHGRKIEAEILADKYCPILEYGVCFIPNNRGKFPKKPPEMLWGLVHP